MFIAFTVICGGIYPAVVTGIAHAVFPQQANGSFITDKAAARSAPALIGQPFSDPKYFWPRPSATADFGYNPAGSGGSNSGPTNPAYLKTVATGSRLCVTPDLPAASRPIWSRPRPAGSIRTSRRRRPWCRSPRVAKARGMTEGAVQKLVAAHTEDRQLGFLGEPRVNVLAVEPGTG